MKNKAIIKFKLKHWEGITLFKVIEQEGFERGCGEIFVGSNGWKVVSDYCVNLCDDEISIGGTWEEPTYEYDTIDDPNKEVYNNVLQTFKELGSCKEDFQPKLGDRVLVSDDREDWEERIFVTSLPKQVNYPIICVIGGHERAFHTGNKYSTNGWQYMKPLQQESSFEEISEDTFEVTFRMKG